MFVLEDPGDEAEDNEEEDEQDIADEQDMREVLLEGKHGLVIPALSLPFVVFFVSIDVAVVVVVAVAVS